MSDPTLESVLAQIGLIKQTAENLVDGLCAQRDEARAEVERLRAVLKLISVQDEGCGGNLRPEEIYRAMQRLALESLK